MYIGANALNSTEMEGDKMRDFKIIDALTGDSISQDGDTGEFTITKGADAPFCTSIFFPGCSMINYAMPLTIAVYDTLREYEKVDGISLLCCGKILSYEPNGLEIRAAFEDEFRDHVAKSSIRRIICACPNCVKALREAFLEDDRVKDVEIAVLPEVLAEIGYRLDKGTVAELVKGDADADVLLCPHDSCPDREYGQFADSLRRLMPDDMWADPEHNRKRSVCCGSLPRAQGKEKAADKCADICGSESVAVGADAIVTACMSCTFQLNMAQSHIPAVHFLELLYNWRINWESVGAWMKVRFLFNDTLGVIRADEGSRSFAGLGSAENADARDKEAFEGDVAISDKDVDSVGL